MPPTQLNGRVFPPCPKSDDLIHLFNAAPLWNPVEFRKTHWGQYQWNGEEMELWPDASGAYNSAIQAYQANNVEEAIDLAETAIELLPRFAEPYIHLSVMYQKFQDWENCVDTVRRAYENIQEEVPDLHFCLGRALHSQGHFGEAIVEFQKEVSVSGKNYNLLRWMLQTFDDQLEPIFRKGNDWANRLEIRSLAGCALVCGFRALAIQSDQGLAKHLCGLWDDFEKTGEWSLETVQALTGMTLNQFKGFRHSFGGR